LAKNLKLNLLDSTDDVDEASEVDERVEGDTLEEVQDRSVLQF